MSHPTALIVTLQMEAAAAERFTELRKLHFPPDRNWLAAHITLFHAVPVTALEGVLADVAEVAGTTASFGLRVDRVLYLGRGVAYGVSAPEGLRLRDVLASRWDELLGRQDRAWQRRLHVTVQNKVAPAAAKALHARLERDFVPEDIQATGLAVWYYVGGPWRLADAFDFASRVAAPKQ